MRSLILKILVGLQTISIWNSPSDQLMHASNMSTYLGAFLPPSGTYEFGGGDISIDPNTGNMTLETASGLIGEISIPTLVTGGDYTALNHATQTIAPIDITNGAIYKVDGQGNLGVGITQLLWDGSTLYASAQLNYDSLQTQHLSHFRIISPWSSPTVTGPYQVGNQGLPENPYGFTAGGSPGAWAGGSMVNIPSQYQAALGGDTLTGQGVTGSIVAATSYGPGVLVFNRGDISAFNASGPVCAPAGCGNGTNGNQWPNIYYNTYGTFAAARPLIGYLQDIGGYVAYDCSPAPPAGCTSINRGSPGGTYDDTWGSRGTILIPGTRSLLFYSIKGTPGSSSYGPTNGDSATTWPNQSCHVWADHAGTPCHDMGHCNTVPVSCGAGGPYSLTGFEWSTDLTVDAEAPHSSNNPYQAVIYAYDLNDLARVKAGTLSPRDIRVYDTWTVTLPFTPYPPGASAIPGNGFTYDSVNHIIYLLQKNPWPASCCSNLPAILAFSVTLPHAPIPALFPTLGMLVLLDGLRKRKRV